MSTAIHDISINLKAFQLILIKESCQNETKSTLDVYIAMHILFHLSALEATLLGWPTRGSLPDCMRFFVQFTVSKACMRVLIGRFHSFNQSCQFAIQHSTFFFYRVAKIIL